jgi:hypothetical protein
MASKQVSAAAALALMLGGVLLTGCDDRPATRAARRGADGSNPATSATTTAPAEAGARTASAGQPATHPAQTQAASAFLTIDGQIVTFPSARLRLTRTDEGVRALLFSNDPKEAISADYQGNSFYFDVALKIADPKEIVEAEYAFKAPTSDAEDDSPNGIFLHGMRTHLQPQDIAITFDGESPDVVARVAGRFLVVHTTGDANTPGQFASVTGTLFVTPEVKGE